MNSQTAEKEDGKPEVKFAAISGAVAADRKLTH
jgi:hypothetical protein